MSHFDDTLIARLTKLELEIQQLRAELASQPVGRALLFAADVWLAFERARRWSQGGQR